MDVDRLFEEELARCATVSLRPTFSFFSMIFFLADDIAPMYPIRFSFFEPVRSNTRIESDGHAAMLNLSEIGRLGRNPTEVLRNACLRRALEGSRFYSALGMCPDTVPDCRCLS